MDLTGIAKPKELDGETIPSAPGKSLVPAFQADVQIARDYLWWLHEGNRALRQGDWKLVASKGEPWELYDLSVDRSETFNLADSRPDVVKQLSELWDRHTEETGDLLAKTMELGKPKRNKAQKRK